MISINITLKDTNAVNLWEAVRGNLASSRVTLSKTYPSQDMAPVAFDVTLRAPGAPTANTGNIVIGDGGIVNTDPAALGPGDSQFYPGRVALAGLFVCATVANDILRLELGVGGPS